MIKTITVYIPIICNLTTDRLLDRLHTYWLAAIYVAHITVISHSTYSVDQKSSPT